MSQSLERLLTHRAHNQAVEIEPSMKPTLFLSHAAKDAKPMGLLRERLLSLTGGAIEIFLSSDGQSIPFGRNWVHEVEEALQRAKLMYVFLSPAALESRWVPFEAGYVYSKGIRVVPVGVMGVDLARVGPPLSLLQGFNIVSGPGMNNLVKIINDTFAFTFGETLSQDDFGQIFLGEQMRSASLFGNHSGWVEEIVFYLTCIHAPEERAVIDFLEKRAVSYVVQGGRLCVSGMEFPLHRGHVDIQVDSLLSALTFPLVEDLVPFLAGGEFNGNFYFRIYLKPPVRAVEGLHRQSARLYGSALELVDKGKIALGAFSFNLHQSYDAQGDSANRRLVPGGVLIEACYAAGDLRAVPIAQALDTLFEVGVLFFDAQA